MGARRQAGRGSTPACQVPVRARKAGSGRGVRGCHFRERQKGGFAIGPTRRGKETKIVAIAAANGLPLAVTVESASPAECRLVEAVLAGCFLDELPGKLIGDKAYDSDALDETLAEEYGIERIAPNRGNRGKTQDGRPLASLQTSLEDRTAVCLDAQLPPSGHAVGVSYRKLPRLCAACLRPDAAQTFMRWLLVGRRRSAAIRRKGSWRDRRHFDIVAGVFNLQLSRLILKKRSEKACRKCVAGNDVDR
jgi:Transposase DDE domain